MSKKDKRRAEAAEGSFSALLETFKAIPEMRLKDVEKFAEILDKQIRPDMPRLQNGCVVLHHKDGSHFFFNHAFIEKVQGFLVVFTENHGVLCFEKDDLVHMDEMKAT